MKFKNLLFTFSFLFVSLISHSQQIGGGYAFPLTNFNTEILSGFYEGLNASGEVDGGGYNHLLNLRHANPANNHQLQIASSYFENDKLFFRKFARGLGSNNPVWYEIATRGGNTFNGNQIFNGNQTINGNLFVLNATNKIVGFADSSNYFIGTYHVDGSSGLDLHWHGGIKFGDSTGDVMNIWNGKVGIGIAAPSAKLEVGGLIKSFVNTHLGTDLNNFQLLNEIGGEVGDNRMLNRLWSLRDVNGTYDWYTGRLHDGISIDASFGTPHVNTKTWWERDPQDNIQSWGNAAETYLTINNGKVGIGTTTPDQKLTVNGTIHSKEVIVDTNITPDYVFQKYYTGKSELKSDYIFPTLPEIENFTKKNNHLPGVPSAKEVQEKGISLGEMSNILLQKIEELTLYTIEQQKELERLDAENNIQ